MVYPPREDLRRALVTRVAQKVDGRGFSRRSIEDATEPPQVATLTACWTPDLGSRVRRALVAEDLGAPSLGVLASIVGGADAGAAGQ